MQWLVSARNIEEADVVGQFGVDRIDLKEPSQGSLGATSPEIWQTVVNRWHRQTQVSIALGELRHVADVRQIPSTTDSVKVGLAGCRNYRNWQNELQELYHRLPSGIGRVAVYYADPHLANSPSSDEVLDIAGRLECQTLLVDTFDKAAGSVFDHMSISQLNKLRCQAQQVGQQFALAGSIRKTHLSAVGQIQPDIVAVRGAVCCRDRTSEISLDALEEFSKSLMTVRELRAGNVLSRG